jgi:hypothetical protein
MNQLVEAVQHDQQAYKLMTTARSNNTVSTVVGFAGGFLIGVSYRKADCW